jgi:hypothetical protein
MREEKVKQSHIDMFACIIHMVYISLHVFYVYCMSLSSFDQPLFCQFSGYLSAQIEYKCVVYVLCPAVTE